jgi:NAD(P)-dependent dehydrogenase (short-subunit alcohol dehydrogenase family)
MARNLIFYSSLGTPLHFSNTTASYDQRRACTDITSLPRNEKLLADPARLRQISERIPAGRWGDPKDFAGPIVFLASRASQYVCGELLVVDGVRLIFS